MNNLLKGKNGIIFGDNTDVYGFKQSLIPDLVETFGFQGKLKSSAAKAMDLPSGIPVTYRAGDQPNNAFSLNALNTGEFAATAGTLLLLTAALAGTLLLLLPAAPAGTLLLLLLLLPAAPAGTLLLLLL